MQTDRTPGSLPPRYQSVLTRVVVRDVTAVDDLLDLVRAEQAEHPDVAVFVTLDQLDQALYTSMHATESDSLEISTDDLDFLEDPHADEVRERRQLARTTAQLAAPDLRVAWSDLRGTLEGAEGDIEALVTVNDAPEGVLDDVLLVLHVPVADPTTAIAGLPNGYFSEDWDVFQNHAVARHLAEGYGYRPLGIGASWVGFLRDQPLDPDRATALVADLAEVYGFAGTLAWVRLADVLTRRTTLFLGYTGSFADL